MLYVCTNCNRTTIICKIFKLCEEQRRKEKELCVVRLITITNVYLFKRIPQKIVTTTKKKKPRKKNYIYC